MLKEYTETRREAKLILWIGLDSSLLNILDKYPYVNCLFLGGCSEELNQTEMMRDKFLELISSFKDCKSLGLNGKHPRVLKELKKKLLNPKQNM